jgi:S1-C subfamily serine protease
MRRESASAAWTALLLPCVFAAGCGNQSRSAADLQALLEPAVGLVRCEFGTASAPGRRIPSRSLRDMEDRLGGEPFNVGSGFLIGDGDLLVTNAHVVNPVEDLGGSRQIHIECSSFEIAFGPDEVYEGTLLVEDDVRDLAVLQLDGRPGPSLPLYTGPTLAKTSEVVLAGFPGASSPDPMDASVWFDPSFKEGSVSRIGPRADRGGVHTVETSVDMLPGHSGGPLCDTCGRVVGVASFGYGQVGERAEYAIAVSELLDLLAEAERTVDVDSTRCQTEAARGLPGSVLGMLVALVGLAVVTAGRRILDTLPRPGPGTPGAGPSPPGWRLQGVTGALHRLDTPLDPTPTAIGRSADVCDVLVPADVPSVALRHAEVRLGPHGVPEVRDTWSECGSRLGGRPLRPGQWTSIARGLELEIGDGAARFTVVRGRASR